MFTYPIWYNLPQKIKTIKKSCLKNYSQRSILKFVRELKLYGFENGLIMIGPGWDQQENYLKINKNLFPHLKWTLSKVHQKGFRLGLTIDPNVHLKSINIFNKKYLLKDDQNENAALINQDTLTFVLDYTNPDTERWFSDRMESVTNLTNQLNISCSSETIRKSFRRRIKSKQEFDCFQFNSIKLTGK